jgi:hypothetical protein
MNVRLEGLPEGLRVIGEWRAGCATISRRRLQIVADAVYAYGMETGHFASGKLARRAGGAFFMRDAVDSLRRSFTSSLAQAIPHGSAAVHAAQDAETRVAVGVAQENAPVRSGNLRSRIFSVDL